MAYLKVCSLLTCLFVYILVWMLISLFHWKLYDVSGIISRNCQKESGFVAQIVIEYILLCRNFWLVGLRDSLTLSWML